MTVLHPENAEELRGLLADANAKGQRLPPFDLRRINAIIEHFPADMTATVQAGANLAHLQVALAQHGQWLPLDPPFPENVTLAHLLSCNLNGPRRFGYGTVRDYLIGIKVLLANGEIIKAGGKVVKNVAGYDLCKLFIGAKDSLGIILEATFKLRPLPEREVVMQVDADSLPQVARVREELLSSNLEPVILDLHNMGGQGALSLVLAFAGAGEDVQHQVSFAKTLGFREGTASAILAYESEFWHAEKPPGQTSVLPSRAIELLQKIIPGKFVARLGNGVIYSREGNARQETPLPIKLMERVKAAYDPNRILPEYSA